MLRRITLLCFVIAVLCSMAFAIGSAAVKGQAESGGIPDRHPVLLSLHFRKELALNEDQVSKLEGIRDSLAKEFAPFKQQADAIQSRMETLQQSAKPDENAGKELKAEGDALGAKLKPLFDRYSQMVAPILTPEQQGKLMKLAEALDHDPKQPDFVLIYVMQSRDQLGITPQQFTKLQYLQADFLRAFAPIREQMELLQQEVQEKFEKAHLVPTPEYSDHAQELQQKALALQLTFSNRAVAEVLLDSQRAKLKELLLGEHRADQQGK